MSDEQSAKEPGANGRPVVEIFTDGACKGNPGPGGWGVILRYGTREKEMSGSDPATTNNRMELMAAIMGLESLTRRSVVKLHTDSIYVLPGHYGDAVPVHPDRPVGAPLAELRATLEPLQLGEDDFVAWATQRATPRPPNYVEIVKANMGRPEITADSLARLELGPNRCSAS